MCRYCCCYVVYCMFVFCPICMYVYVWFVHVFAHGLLRPVQALHIGI